MDALHRGRDGGFKAKYQLGTARFKENYPYKSMVANPISIIGERESQRGSYSVIVVRLS